MKPSLYILITGLMLSGCISPTVKSDPKDTHGFAEMMAVNSAMSREEADKVNEIMGRQYATKQITVEDGKYLLWISRERPENAMPANVEVATDRYTFAAEAFAASGEIPVDLQRGVFDLAVRMTKITDKNLLCKDDAIALFVKLNDPRAMPYIDELAKDPNSKVRKLAERAKRRMAKGNVT